jgi:formate dehydrogenase iron-sulfur subunit
MEWNDLRDAVGTNTGSYNNPPDLDAQSWTVMRFFEVEPDGKLEWLIRKDGCMHCADPGCLKACPSPGAIVQYSNGIVDFQEENCIGCGYCITGCPFNVPRISKKDNKAYKCTLCSDRVAVGLEPACVKTCPTGAIVFGSKDDMKFHAEERIVDLKERGYQNAGLYDPPGVGGTHVMYVLQHADRPELYSLPKDPHVSPLVSLWKGVGKPLALLALGVAAVGSFFHFVKVGPNEVEEEENKA